MEKKKINEKLKNKSVKGLFAIGIVVMVMFSLVPLGATATNAINDDTTESTDFKVTTKAKAATVKVTWNANGGKIGTKKTTTTSVKKGKKIGKLPKTPKLAGYTFKGWYTKKTGGTKITKNTKVKKKVTYFAQWTKGSSNSSTNNRVLTAEENKLVGKWVYEWDKSMIFQFNANGTYSKLSASDYYDVMFIGTFSLKNGVLTKLYQCRYDYGSGWGSWSAWETSASNITFGTKTDGTQYFSEYGLKYLKV